MNPLTHARRLWSRFSIPPASAQMAVAALEAGAKITVPKEDLRHIMKVAQREDRLPVLDVRTCSGWSTIKRGRRPRKKR